MNGFAPEIERQADVEDNEAIFEMQASYIGTNMPDILDKYKVEDLNYGLNITDVNEEEYTIRWSPMMMQDATDDDLHYSLMDFGILYKLYLGFNEETLSLFSSLCQIEETNEILDWQF
jgi:hypothetical protein